MANPTLVVITDRIDLDNQLFGVFSRCRELLRQEPKQAEDREHLKELLQVPSGGVIFTTLQKFLAEPGASYPCLSDRTNIVVICDEAHRSHYDFVDGFARHMRDAVPNASFIAFTGTPIELVGKHTVQVFGNYIDVYNIRQAVEDEATVPIYYEGRLIPLDLSPDEEPLLDEEFDDITEDEEDEEREKLKSRWSRLEKLVGAEDRVERLAADLVAHFEQRLEVMDGKGMVVCMSRRICGDLYNEIIALRPDWHADDDDEGSVKVVMTGSASDPAGWQQHIRNKNRREDLAKRFKDPANPFRLAIVRDMWLTGFDAPPLHTMYVDKPMQGHGLMQTIARVSGAAKCACEALPPHWLLSRLRLIQSPAIPPHPILLGLLAHSCRVVGSQVFPPVRLTCSMAQGRESLPGTGYPPSSLAQPEFSLPASVRTTLPLSRVDVRSGRFTVTVQFTLSRSPSRTTVY